MTKAKDNRKKNAPIAEAVLPPPAWPADFAPPRTALTMAACCAALGAMLFIAALFGALVPVKVALASLLNMYNPAMVSDSSFDLAAMMWGMGAIILGGIVHPSIGIAILVVFRPWIDGYTFPTDNLGFVSAVFVLSALWGVRVVLRGGRIRGLGFAAPLALWLLVAVAGLHSTWEVDATSRQLLLWFSYLMLFVLIVNNVTSRLSMGILLGGVCAVMGLEGLFALLHYEFLLPFLREIIHKPAILREFFNTDTMTPELARRFSINRAFGSVLFPNSLAAYLMLGIPVVAAGAWLAWQRLRETAGTAVQPSSPRASSLAALAMWLASTVLVMFACHFPAVYRDDTGGSPWYFQIGTIFVFGTLVAVVPAGWVYFLSLRRGLVQCGRTLAAWGLTLGLALALVSMMLTYSRGGWIALAAACVWAALLLRGGPALSARLRRLFPALVAVLLVAGLAWGWSRAVETGTAWAQDPKHAAAPAAASDAGSRSTEVTQEGTTVSTKDLLDPASFRIRLTYWRVAMAMAKHNLLTGVGLGNFAIAYAHYQYLGAGDVREAHSGYLQSFCETGIPGGLLFTLFWAVLVIGGALNVLRAPDRRTRLWLVGLHAGMLAFCLHAAMDINFSHPSLVMTAMVLAGMGLGWRGSDLAVLGCAVPKAAVHRLLAGGMLVLIALAGGLAARIWVQELALSRLACANYSNDQEIYRRFRVANFLLNDVYRYAVARDSGKPPRKPPQLPFREAININPDPDRWAKTSEFFVPDSNSAEGYRKLNPGEPIPMDSVMLLHKPRLAQWAAVDGVCGWLAEMEAVDSKFPHNPMLAMHIARLYELLIKTYLPAQTYAERQKRWAEGYCRWAEKALERSPNSAEMHEFYAGVMGYRALYGSPKDPVSEMESAVSHARTAVEFSPLAPSYRSFLAWALENMANLLRQAGDAAKADATARQAAQVKQEAQDLQTRRWQLGFDQ